MSVCITEIIGDQHRIITPDGMNFSNEVRRAVTSFRTPDGYKGSACHIKRLRSDCGDTQDVEVDLVFGHAALISWITAVPFSGNIHQGQGILMINTTTGLTALNYFASPTAGEPWQSIHQERWQNRQPREINLKFGQGHYLQINLSGTTP